jgi:hypothetical protein
MPLSVQAEAGIESANEQEVRRRHSYPRRLGCAGELLFSLRGWNELTRA